MLGALFFSKKKKNGKKERKKRMTTLAVISAYTIPVSFHLSHPFPPMQVVNSLPTTAPMHSAPVSDRDRPLWVSFEESGELVNSHHL